MPHILFCADEHVLVRRKGVPSEFEKSRYRKLFEELLILMDTSDCLAMIHGGDLFDRAPNIEEIALVAEYLNKVTKPCYIINGNHEATKKGQTFLGELYSIITNSKVVFINVYDTVFLEDKEDTTIDFIPYNMLKHFEKNGHFFEGSKHQILVTHVRGEISPHVTPEVDLSIFDKWQIVLAGDLHSRDCSQRNIQYPGSPLATSFYRDHAPTKGIIKLDLETLHAHNVALDIPALVRKTVSSKEEVGQPFDERGNYIDYEIVPEEKVKVVSVEEDNTPVLITKEMGRLDALSSVLQGTEKDKQEVLDLYVKIIGSGS